MDEATGDRRRPVRATANPDALHGPRLAWASYRLRLPLSLMLAVVLTAAAMALALGLQTLTNLREDQGRFALHLGYAMAEVQVQALRNDDVWLAYSLLRGPAGGAGDAVWILVDADGRIFASNQPRRFRLDDPLPQALPWLPLGAQTNPVPPLALAATTDLSPIAASAGQVVAVKHEAFRRLLRLPLYSDGTQVGELLALLSDAPYLPRFFEILTGGVLVTGGVLLLFLPLGWLWGRRLVAPLERLADCMGRVGREDPRQLDCSLTQDASEVGRLGRQFAAMVMALGEKAALEQRMVQSERLAAVGQVAAGVAHEVNNPLGGMLMAIDTYRQSHGIDAPTARLLDLLERALAQIRAAVSALLVEARADQHPLTRADLEDARTLIQPNLARTRVHLDWHNQCDGATALPAAPVRQLLLNLLLNAVTAAGDGGRVRARITTGDGELQMSIDNDGRTLPSARLAHLFEPYVGGADGAPDAAMSGASPADRQPPDDQPPDDQPRGLGLWVCYQIVTQLGGNIGAERVGDWTAVRVRLPLAPLGADMPT